MLIVFVVRNYSITHQENDIRFAESLMEPSVSSGNADYIRTILKAVGCDDLLYKFEYVFNSEDDTWIRLLSANRVA